VGGDVDPAARVISLGPVSDVKTYMQDNKMMKDNQIPDNPPGRLLFRNLFQEKQGMREKKKSILSIRVSNTKLPIRVKEKCEDFYYTKRMSSDGLGESDTSPGTGRVEPIVSIIENKQRASQHVTANGRRTTRTGSEDFVDLHGFTASGGV